MSKSTFGILDYLRMFRSRGVRLPIAYFFQNHLFDLVSGTDTHQRLPKTDYKDTPENFSHGVLYMSSWTNVIRNSTRDLLRHTEIQLDDCLFMDLGCGKGKVLCVWSAMFKDSPKTPSFIGIEYSEHLISVCKRNLNIVKGKNVELLHTDVAKLSFDDEFVHRVIYMYNPFDEKILRKVLSNLRKPGTFIIYNNPVFDQIFQEFGFARIKNKLGWHPNSSYSIYEYRSTINSV